MPYAKTIITLLPVAAIVILNASSVLRDGESGVLTIALLLFGTALIAGLYDAWARGSSAAGWLGSIVTALAGTAIGFSVSSQVLRLAYVSMKLEGRPRPLILAAFAIVTLLGAWSALWIAGRFRRTSS